MPHPIVIAHHLIWTVYGHWLPNDPRGSTSSEIASEPLARFGELHFGRRPAQPKPATVAEFKKQAQPGLKFPVFRLDAAQIESVASALANALSAHRYTCYACAILPDHVHLIIRKHRHNAEEMIDKLQRAARLPLLGTNSGLPPDHPIWTEFGWHGFLDHPKAVHSTIGYVSRNPAKERLSAQHWTFVKKYDNWPFHAGHSPNSPYAKRLKRVD